MAIGMEHGAVHTRDECADEERARPRPGARADRRSFSTYQPQQPHFVSLNYDRQYLPACVIVICSVLYRCSCIE